ncbi:MAG: fused MFS/spermidine synthase [Gemmatales bacterium]|nr:fused MFS/spermidine synthase [Gemmatales bacterium]MDW8386880.1 fused MFS/spermidine synthase [Gemmatales bacterium]
MRREIVLGSTVAFIASFCTLVIELVAGRILAPYVGVSLYTWTSIIGVVLAGISLGAYFGGLLADRYPRGSTLGWLLFLSGLTSLAVPILADSLGDAPILRDPNTETLAWLVVQSGMSLLMARILVTTTLVFFVPALLLGMISPVVVKLAVQDLEKTGNTVGKIYAFSTLGSILGTFATGFFLIEAMGTRTLLYSVGALLILCAPIFGLTLAPRRNGRLGQAVVAACILALIVTLSLLWSQREAVARPMWLYFDSDDLVPRLVEIRPGTYYKESDYYTIRVVEENFHGDPGRTLVLDHLIHSYTNLNDPFYLKYDYLKIYEELVAWHRSRRADANDFLFIGGGGYTLPRYFDHAYEDARIDVVEIDPMVSKVAHEMLGIKDTRIRTFNMDGRWFVMNKELITHSSDRYDYIFGDAFNDLSIPYHLTTKEFDSLLKQCLKPDGLLMCLVIDNVSQGHFIPTYIRTLQEVFGQDNVYLVVFSESPLDEIPCHTCIVVASPSRLDMDDFDRFMDQRLARQKGVTSAVGAVGGGWVGWPMLTLQGMIRMNPSQRTSRVISQKDLQHWLRTRKEKTGREPMVLTDDYCPVDNLTAPMFEERFGFRKQ